MWSFKRQLLSTTTTSYKLHVQLNVSFSLGGLQHWMVRCGNYIYLPGTRWLYILRSVFAFFRFFVRCVIFKKVMAKEILRLNSELLKTFHRRLCYYNYCQWRTFVFLNPSTQQQNIPTFSLSCCRLKSSSSSSSSSSSFKSTKNTKNEKQKKDINSLVQPVSVKPYIDPDGINIGEELTGTLKKGTAHSVM